MKYKMQKVRFAILKFVIIWNGSIKNLRNAWRLFLRALSGGPSKSVPLDFGTKNSLPSLFVSEKGMAHINRKSKLLFFSSLSLLLRAKIEFGRTGVADHDQKGEVHLFCKVCYVP